MFSQLYRRILRTQTQSKRTFCSKPSFSAEGGLFALYNGGVVGAFCFGLGKSLYNWNNQGEFEPTVFTAKVVVETARAGWLAILWPIPVTGYLISEYNKSRG